MNVQLSSPGTCTCTLDTAEPHTLVFSLTVARRQVSFRPPALEDRNGIIVGYSIRVQLVSFLVDPSVDPSSLAVTTISYQNITVSETLGEHTVTVQGLRPFALQNISVAARTGVAGLGPFSAPTEVATASAAPEGAPASIRVLGTFDGIVVIRWEDVEIAERNGAIIEYGPAPVFLQRLSCVLPACTVPPLRTQRLSLSQRHDVLTTLGGSIRCLADTRWKPFGMEQRLPPSLWLAAITRAPFRIWRRAKHTCFVSPRETWMGSARSAQSQIPS